MSDKIQKAIQNKVLAMLEEGTIPWRKTWNLECGTAKNIITNKAYRGSNYFMLNCQGYSSPYWMTFKQAKNLGGFVRKGQKSTPITVWYTVKPKEGEEEKKQRGYFGMALVFNLAQTDEVKVPKREEDEVKKYNNDPLANCEQILSEFTDPPAVKWGMKPCYNLTQDIIGMPKIKKFESSEEFYAVYFHEMGHSTRHLTRLNRIKTSYAKEELVAEMTACFLCGSAGIETATIDNQVAYINEWRKEISKDPKIIMQAASEAQKAANYIMNINQFTEMKEAS